MGSCISLLLVSEKIVDRISLVDVVPGLSWAVARDLHAAAASIGVDIGIEAYEDASDVREADIVVITAGRPRKPGMTRMDLLKVNAEITRDIARRIYPNNEEAVYLIVTNPVDLIATLFKRYTGGNVIGSGCHLDTLRFRIVLAEMLNVKPSMIEGYVGGGHGRHIVPLWSTVKVEGIPIHKWLKAKGVSIDMEKARDETTLMADKIIQKAGGTMLGPAAAFVEIIKAIALDEGKTLSIATPYKIDKGEIYLSRPVKVGREIVEIPNIITEEEKQEINTIGRKLLDILSSLQI